MLSGIILLITAIVIVWLWYLESGEHRRKNKELQRITQRLEKQRLDSIREEVDFDVTILWGDIVAILDSLQTASKHPEGVQGIKDLALLIDNKNLIIKRQGKYIRVNNIPHLQEFIDTYDSEIQCLDYLNDYNVEGKTSEFEQEVSETPLNSKKGAYLALAKVVSNKNAQVYDEISLYFDKPEKYFDKFYFDLTQRGIDKLSNLPEVVVLIDALTRQKKLVYKDVNAEMYHALEALDLIVDNKLFENSRYTNLVEQAKISLIGLSALDDNQGEVVFEAISESGYKLLGIDESSGSYALIMIPRNILSQFIELSDLVDIKLQFIDKA